MYRDNKQTKTKNMKKIENTQNYSLNYKDNYNNLTERKFELIFNENTLLKNYSLFELIGIEKKFISNYMTPFCATEDIFTNILD